jgi:hypothetical protein
VEENMIDLGIIFGLGFLCGIFMLKLVQILEKQYLKDQPGTKWDDRDKRT